MNSLFDRIVTESQNLIPYDGIALYSKGFMDKDLANKYFDSFLTEIAWSQDRLKMFGREITTKRKVAWYGNQPYKYTYSKSDKFALPWTKTLTQLKTLVEAEAHENFNSCLLNLYHDGSEGMGWHADDETELLHHGTIASVSLGAQRKFVFKHRRTIEKVELQLENGSLLLMQGEIQDHWLHRLTTTTKVSVPRINLTFRTIDTRIITKDN